MAVMRGTQPVPAARPTRHRQESKRSALRHPLAVHAAGLALLAVLTPLHGSWAVQLLLVPLLLIVPGVILLRTLRMDGATIAMNPVYVPAASVLVLMASSLGVDLIGPPIGITAPLRAAPLLVALEVVCVALLACSLNAPPRTDIPWGLLSRPDRLAWPLLVPLLSAAGALRLNSGHTAHVAEFAVVVVIIVLVAAFLFAPRCDDSLLLVIVFAAALAMMWSFSLRGDLVYGFDISSEYHSLNQTVTAGVWHVSHRGDAYGAMLSVTVLPAALHALSGIPALFIFKAVYPVIGALFPVAVFSLARRVLAGRWAFMAAALVVIQQAFFQELPALARQEIALVLFGALVCAVLDTSLSTRMRCAFVCLLTLGMVVAHYSTTYLAIPLLGIAAVLQWATSWFRPVPRLTGALLLACLVSVGGSILWYGSITHSTSNTSQFLQVAAGQGIDLLPNQGTNPLATYLQGEQERTLTPAQYERLVSDYYKTHDKFVIPLSDAAEPQYALKAAVDPGSPITSRLGSSVTSLADLLIQQALNVLGGIGALLLVCWRRVPVIARQIGLLGLGSMAILVLTRVSGTIAQEYNPQRAFVQALIVLAIGICWTFQRIGARWKRTRPALLGLGAATIVLFMVGSSSLAGVAFGGGTAANLADSYNDYQEFVASAPDVAAAAWVAKAAPAGQFIYADNYAQLRLDTVAGPARRGVFDAITPETLDRHAWVYATTVNLKDNIVRALLGSDAASYAFPRLFLNSNYNVVYTNGSSEVFHR
jgi:uncharacterized membrane protein